MASVNSSPQSTMHHCSCCPLFQLATLPLPQHPQQKGKKRLFFERETDDSGTATLRLPPLPKSAPSYSDCSSGGTMRINGGFLTRPDSMPSRMPLLSNAPLMEAFATEYQKRPSHADVAYWRKMRREVVCGNLCHFVVSADHNRQTFRNARDVTWKQCSVKAGS